MLKKMRHEGETGSLLVIDTCGERGSVALFRAHTLQATRMLEERTASAGLLGVVRELLQAQHLLVHQLAGIGVVNGPGSFTGLRVGLAVTKGLCEAGQLPVGAVSRLAVLAHAGSLQQGYAALRAGRDDLYVREQRRAEPARERLISAASLAVEIREGDEVVYAEEALQPMLPDGIHQRLVTLNAQSAYPLVQAVLAAGGTDLSALDANYVRNEQAIYARQTGPAV